MDIRVAQAIRGYSATKAVELPNDGAVGSPMIGAAKDFAATLRNAETVAQDAMTGSADPHALVEALANTQMAVETAVTVRDKVVEAYQEILRMPV